MPVILRILLGFAIMAVGALITIRATVVAGWTGPISFAEEKLGPGQTDVFIKLFGIVVVFVGIFTATNIISNILASLARLFVRG